MRKPPLDCSATITKQATSPLLPASGTYSVRATGPARALELSARRTIALSRGGALFAVRAPTSRRAIPLAEDGGELGWSSRHGRSRRGEAIVSIVSITDETVALGPYGAPRARDVLVQQNEDAIERAKRSHVHLASAGQARASGFPMSSRCTSAASASRSELGCERAGQAAGTVFMYRSGSLGVCRL
jgi:hypothetical protein